MPQVPVSNPPARVLANDFAASLVPARPVHVRTITPLPTVNVPAPQRGGLLAEVLGAGAAIGLTVANAPQRGPNVVPAPSEQVQDVLSSEQLFETIAVVISNFS